MTNARIFLTGFAALFVAELLATLVHGYVLAADYAPYYGTLLRGSQDPAWQFAFLPLAHLAWVGALVWTYVRVTFAGSRVVQGLKLGLFGWVIGQVPLWLIWFAEQPWPNGIVLKQLVLELISSLAVGVTIAACARRAGQRATTQAAHGVIG
jgi:hypothetical protein